MDLGIVIIVGGLNMTLIKDFIEEGLGDYETPND
jgi:hypothetical protein